MKETIDNKLPTIGVLLFEGFLASEVLAPVDVFTKSDSTGAKLFNVILVAKELRPYVSEEGLQVLPNTTIAESPDLDVLVIPSSLTPEKQTSDPQLIEYIRRQGQSADYVASHCAGAFLLGEAGVADHASVVTYVGGGEKLKASYPALRVANDETHATVRDGKIFSSNGGLVSYPASLELLEALTSREHRKHVEEELLFHKLKL